MKKIVVFMADGMEECECLIAVDVLKRAGFGVTTASVMGRETVVSTHKIEIKADALVENVDFKEYDGIVLPGGLPGADYLRDNAIVQEQCKAFAADSAKAVAAICAAPRVLAGLGLLQDKVATVYPGIESDMCGAKMTGQDVAVAGNIITGRALGAAIPFALEIVKYFTNEATAQKIADQIVY